MVVSFVIPVRNDAVRLERCLNSIRRSTYPRACIAILVIDNGSTDGSGGVAARLGATVISMSAGRVADLRNHGASIATGDVLAFIDSDNEISSDWIPSAVETLQLQNIAATGALCSAPDAGTWVQRTYGSLRGEPHGTHDVEWLGGGNLAVRRSAFVRAGGFDTTLDTCEDVDLCNRLRELGGRIVSDARLKSVHHGDPRTLSELFTGELWRGRDNLRVSLRTPLTVRAIPSIFTPIADLALIVIAAAGAALAMFGRAEGLLLMLFACSTILIPVSLRLARIVACTGERTATHMMAMFAVACVYDVARALALVARMPHHRKRVAES